jgi:hypothetical protein
MTLTILPGLLGASPPSDRDPVGERNIIRARTDAQGVADEELAARTGWRVARGFQWQILLQGPDGLYRPARPDRPFETGQAFRLELEADSDLWIYLLNRGPDGSEVVLLPERGEGHLLVRKGERVLIPPTGQFRFQEPPGAETFRILASPERLSWVNPHELFRWESGAPVDAETRERARSQKQLRSTSIDAIRKHQADPLRFERPLSQMVAELGPGAGSKALVKSTVVVAPLPEDGSDAAEPPSREQVVRVSSDPANRDPLVYDIQLRHQHP